MPSLGYNERMDGEGVVRLCTKERVEGGCSEKVVAQVSKESPLCSVKWGKVLLLKEWGLIGLQRHIPILVV